ncbi:MAG TPA: hypothetical protein VK610_03090, partial [Rhodothermales bacterium]|nr:hypothetical protein [Rhodothermales bacterium]
PSGFTNNRQIPMAKSIMDYIFRYLSVKYVGRDQHDPEEAPVNPSVAVASVVDRSGPAQDETQADLFAVGASPEPLVGHTVEQFLAAPRKAPAAFRNQEDAPACPKCGGITVRAGACYSCPNCGSSTGCG